MKTLKGPIIGIFFLLFLTITACEGFIKPENHDGFLEEAIEAVLKKTIGLDIDLTPESEEMHKDIDPLPFIEDGFLLKELFKDV